MSFNEGVGRPSNLDEPWYAAPLDKRDVFQDSLIVCSVWVGSER